MRGFSEGFMSCLKAGFLTPILQAVREDQDLNLAIRQGYINIYYKGNSLLKLEERSQNRYKVQIHEKFAAELQLPEEITDEQAAQDFVSNIPFLKQNIIVHGKSSLEIEYEQLIVRANNDELRNSSEYFMVDRQYAVGDARFDLIGVFWDRVHRRRNQEVDLCLIEVKFALNQDITTIDQQLTRYYDSVKPIAAKLAEECETVFHQKLELGLYKQAQDRLEAMKTLTISKDLSRFQFILLLVDYNPNSARLDLEALRRLPFHEQVRIYYGGMAMWQQNVKPVGDEISAIVQ